MKIAQLYFIITSLCFVPLLEAQISEQGPPGAAVGKKCTRSIQGPTGPTGPQGFVGPSPQGPQGDRGPTGLPGTNAANGARGATGPNISFLYAAYADLGTGQTPSPGSAIVFNSSVASSDNPVTFDGTSTFTFKLAGVYEIRYGVNVATVTNNVGLVLEQTHLGITTLLPGTSFILVGKNTSVPTYGGVENIVTEATFAVGDTLILDFPAGSGTLTLQGTQPVNMTDADFPPLLQAYIMIKRLRPTL